jgi:hypothetical protein
MYSVGTKDEEKQNLAKLEALEKLVSERPSYKWSGDEVKRIAPTPQSNLPTLQAAVVDFPCRVSTSNEIHDAR